MWTDFKVKRDYLEGAGNGTRIDNCVRILFVSEQVSALNQGDKILRDMGKSLQTYPTLTEKQRDFAKSLIMKGNHCHFLATTLNDLMAEGVDTLVRINPEYLKDLFGGDPGLDNEAGPDEVEIIRHKAKPRISEPEPEPEDYVKPTNWGMF